MKTLDQGELQLPPPHVSFASKYISDMVYARGSSCYVAVNTTSQINLLGFNGIRPSKIYAKHKANNAT